MPSTALQTSNREEDCAPGAQKLAGNRAAPERLLHVQVEPLRRYFSRRVSCCADADDLVQRTLLATLDALPRFREDVVFSGFVAAIARKLLLHYHRDELRARSRCDADACPDEVQCEQSSVLSRVVHEHEAQELRRVLGRISDESLRILQLRYWDEHDAEEIGRLLGLSRGAVRTRLHRARGELRRALLGTRSSSRARRKLVTIDAVGERKG